MLFLIALILAVGFALLCGKALKKYPYIFYAAAVIVTVVTSILAVSDLRSVPVFVNTYIIGLFTRGAFATALWCVVMWTGAMPNGSVPIKKLMPVRGELSIFAAILTLGHNIGFGRTYLVRLFTDSGRMSTNQITASILTIIMLLIMIPLTVMSFPQVRKKMNAKLWKKIQRTAYIFYGLIYIHVMTLCVPMAKAGREGYLFSILVYSVVFIGYGVCRVRKWFIVCKKPENCTTLNTICIAAFVILVAAAGFISKGSSQNTNRPAEKTVNVVSDVVTTAVSKTSSVTTTSAVTTAVTANTSTNSSTAVSTAVTTITQLATDNEEAVQSDEENVSQDELAGDEEQDKQEEQPQQAQQTQQAKQPQQSQQSQQQSQQSQQSQQEVKPQPTEPPEPSYIYKNGTYSASAYGYDGEVHVSVTIENDIITAISGYTDESDSWYFESAQGSVISQILSSQSTSVDAYAGATYSSNAIMSAVQTALDSARN